MTHIAWTDRQRREADYYRQYSNLQNVTTVDFSPVQGEERRPWNPYWFVYELARNRFVSGSQRILDFGCGNGTASLRFAYVGYQVDGFDICKENIEIAQRLAERYDLEDRCTFRPMTAEHLNYADNTFDIVVGIDILHHIELEKAVSEAHRVLKPGGVAIFKEHMEVPLLDPIRNSTFFRALAPNDTSMKHHITDDERKLNQDDLQSIRRMFEHMQTERFTLASRIDRLIPGCTDNVRGRLQRLDRHLIRACPQLAGLGNTVVMVCHKDARVATSSRAAA